MRVWTEDAKQKQRDAIKRWAPWTKSSGPKTSIGKSRSSLNAVKHGMRSVQGKRLLKLFSRQRQFIRSVYSSLKMRKKSTNELLRTMTSHIPKTPQNPTSNIFIKQRMPHDRP